MESDKKRRLISDETRPENTQNGQRQDAMRQDSLRQESMRQEAIRQDAIRQDSIRQQEAIMRQSAPENMRLMNGRPSGKRKTLYLNLN